MTDDWSFVVGMVEVLILFLVLELLRLVPWHYVVNAIIIACLWLPRTRYSKRKEAAVRDLLQRHKDMWNL